MKFTTRPVTVSIAAQTWEQGADAFVGAQITRLTMVRIANTAAALKREMEIRDGPPTRDEIRAMMKLIAYGRQCEAATGELFSNLHDAGLERFSPAR